MWNDIGRELRHLDAPLFNLSCAKVDIAAFPTFPTSSVSEASNSGDRSRQSNVLILLQFARHRVEALAISLDEAALPSLATMATAAGQSQNTATFSGKSKDALQVVTNMGSMSIVHYGGEDTGEMTLL